MHSCDVIIFPLFYGSKPPTMFSGGPKGLRFTGVLVGVCVWGGGDKIFVFCILSGVQDSSFSLGFTALCLSILLNLVDI